MSAHIQYHSLIAAYQAAARTGDATGVASLFTEDAVFLLPDQPAIKGRQAIEDYYKESIGNGFAVTIEIQDIQERSETVYGNGVIEYEGGSGKWLQVLQRQSDGTLLIHRLCSNQN